MLYHIHYIVEEGWRQTGEERGRQTASDKGRKRRVGQNRG